MWLYVHLLITPKQHIKHNTKIKYTLKHQTVKVNYTKKHNHLECKLDTVKVEYIESSQSQILIQQNGIIPLYCYVPSITCSVIAQQCVKAHMQSQWRKPKFDPRKI